MFGKSPAFRKNHSSDDGKQKITVADIVSTTVTDLVAETGLEPATSGL